MLVFTLSGSTEAVESHRWTSPGGQGSVTLDAAVARDLARQALDGSRSLPKRGMEVGGILLGRIDHGSPVHIEVTGFEPVPCEHKLGPSFVLSESDRERLEGMLAQIRASGAQIAGYYRSFTGSREPVLEESDEELVRRYFSSGSQALLLIKPLPGDQCVADLVLRQAPEMRSPLPLEGFVERKHPVPQVFKRRAARPQEDSPEEVVKSHSRSTLWLSVALCIAIGWASAATYEWLRISREWQEVIGARPTATSQSSVEPAKPPAAVATAQTETPSTPVKQAESSASVATPPAVAQTAVAPPAPATAIPEPPPPDPPKRAVRIVAEPKVVSEIQPTVPAGIRARIKDTIVIPVLVEINSSGRVVKAVPQRRGDGLYQYLAARAVAAAKEWRFSSARGSDGSAMPATKTLYFTFRS